jgi:hypothetical protein
VIVHVVYLYMTKTGIDNVEQNCIECGRTCSNRRSLGNHMTRSHPHVGGLKNYVLKHFLQGNVPECSCGCGGKVEWHETKYQFNSYITGHNKSGFRAKQPEFTREQIDKRNESIRRAYSTKRSEIVQKISSGVSEAMKESGINFSEYFKEKWKDEDFKDAQHVARIKSWEGVEGDARREKVFTPEFGRKIGLANMRRESTYTSKAENEFANRLRECGIEIAQSVWFNLGEKTWNADVWIPSTKTIVEFDGTYWHGLDRHLDWKPDQIKNLTNDLKKNRIARDRGLNLLRISADIDPGSINGISDLERLAYHVVKGGVVIKEGTFKLGETTPLITRDSVIRMALGDDGKNYLKESILPIVEEFLRAHVGYWDWFYPPSDKAIQEVMSSLFESSDTFSMSPHGSDWLKSRVRSFWDVDGGPSKMFNVDKTLRSVLSYRLGLNNSKPYEYSLMSGEKVTTNETFNITMRDVRNGFIVQRNKVSWFKPVWASYIYRRFCGGLERPVVWDPSIGFSARMLGFASVFERGTYIGTDPCSHMCRDAGAVSKEIMQGKPGLDIQVIRSGSEVWIPEVDSLDLVFTSPPYFDAEQYYDEPGQCWRDHSDFDTWKSSYYVKTLQGAAHGLKSSGSLVLNVPQSLRGVTIECAEAAGLFVVDELHMSLGRDHFARGAGSSGDSRHELFMVFRRKI